MPQQSYRAEEEKIILRILTEMSRKKRKYIEPHGRGW